MQIKRFASTVVMALAMMAQFAYAAVILQVDIADPNKIKFIATGENALINNSDYSYADGITLQEVFSNENSISEAGMDGTLVVSLDEFDLKYDSVSVTSNALGLYVEELSDDDNDSDPAVVNRQKFTTSSPAFSGISTVEAFGSTVTLKEVGSTGEVVAGYEETGFSGFSGSIGQWEIIDSTSLCIANEDTRSCTEFTDQDYTGGTATCNASGNAFDLSGCEYCGNAVQEGDEFCDARVPAGLTCSDVGFPDGTDLVKSCKTDCSGYDVSGCSLLPTTPTTDKSADPAILWLLLKPQSSDDEG